MQGSEGGGLTDAGDGVLGKGGGFREGRTRSGEKTKVTSVNSGSRCSLAGLVLPAIPAVRDVHTVLMGLINHL